MVETDTPASRKLHALIWTNSEGSFGVCSLDLAFDSTEDFMLSISRSNSPDFRF